MKLDVRETDKELPNNFNLHLNHMAMPDTSHAFQHISGVQLTKYISQIRTSKENMKQAKMTHTVMFKNFVHISNSF